MLKLWHYMTRPKTPAQMRVEMLDEAQRDLLLAADTLARARAQFDMHKDNVQRLTREVEKDRAPIEVSR